MGRLPVPRQRQGYSGTSRGVERGHEVGNCVAKATTTLLLTLCGEFSVLQRRDTRCCEPVWSKAERLNQHNSEARSLMIVFVFDKGMEICVSGGAANLLVSRTTGSCWGSRVRGEVVSFGCQRTVTWTTTTTSWRCQCCLSARN